MRTPLTLPGAIAVAGLLVDVNGDPYTGDPGAIELTDHKEIAIVIGAPPPEIPKTADFSKA